MPSVRIEVRRNWSAGEAQALKDGVHAAMVEALRIPAQDRLLRLCRHAPEDFDVPPGASENYTLVEIALFAGRTLQAKRDLYRLIVERLGRLGIAPADVRIVLHESPPENWGIRGGQAACDLDLGFNIKV